MAAGLELRMHTPLVSGFHAKGQDCPEVFRGHGGSWISCSHPVHLEEPEQYRRRRLIDKVIPTLVAKTERTVVSDSNEVTPTEEKKGPRRSRTPRECTCGCGEMTRGGKFRPGHDARLHSSLVATVSDVETRLETRQDALRKLEALNWGNAVPENVKKDLKDGYS